MTQEEKNIQIVAQWFDAVWGENYDPSVIEKLAHKDMVMYYPLHSRRVGHDEMRGMLDRLRGAFDLKCEIFGDIVTNGDYVCGKWSAAGTHTGGEFNDLPGGVTLPANSGRSAKWTGMTFYKVVDGKIVEEIGEEDALGAAMQLGLIGPC